MIFRLLLAGEFPLVAGLALAGTLDDRFYTAAVVLELGFCLYSRVKLGRWGRRTPIDWALVFLLLTLPVTLRASAMPEITLPQVWRLLAGAALFYALVNWAVDLRRLRLAVDAALALGILLAVAAPFIVRWNALKLLLIPAELYSRFRLLVVDSVNPNVIAGALVLLALLAAGLLLFAGREQTGWSTWERLLALVCLALSIVVLFLTQSRGGWLALLGGLGILLALRWRRGWMVLLAIAAAAALATDSDRSRRAGRTGGEQP